MGLLKLLFGFDKSDYEELQGKLEGLGEENEELKQTVKNLQEQVSKLEKELLASRRALNTVIEDIEYIKQKLEEELEEEEALEDSGELEIEDSNMEELEETILSLIIQGVTSPKDLLERTGWSKHKLYDVLKSLTEKGLVDKERDGRRVHYKPVTPPPTPSS
ncbi:MAG: helix-turn-helix domain-containing protein [Desulfurococcales archaeon]|nr:helix-turn-helix domain-containing protein [Desulfurococcales archaeon]